MVATWQRKSYHDKVRAALARNPTSPKWVAEARYINERLGHTIDIPSPPKKRIIKTQAYREAQKEKQLIKSLKETAADRKRDPMVREKAARRLETVRMERERRYISTGLAMAREQGGSDVESVGYKRTGDEYEFFATQKPKSVQYYDVGQESVPYESPGGRQIRARDAITGIAYAAPPIKKNEKPVQVYDTTTGDPLIRGKGYSLVYPQGMVEYPKEKKAKIFPTTKMINEMVTGTALSFAKGTRNIAQIGVAPYMGATDPMRMRKLLKAPETKEAWTLYSLGALTAYAPTPMMAYFSISGGLKIGKGIATGEPRTTALGVLEAIPSAIPVIKGKVFKQGLSNVYTPSVKEGGWGIKGIIVQKVGEPVQLDLYGRQAKGFRIWDRPATARQLNVRVISARFGESNIPMAYYDPMAVKSAQITPRTIPVIEKTSGKLTYITPSDIKVTDTGVFFRVGKNFREAEGYSIPGKSPSSFQEKLMGYRPDTKQATFTKSIGEGMKPFYDYTKTRQRSSKISRPKGKGITTGRLNIQYLNQLDMIMRQKGFVGGAQEFGSIDYMRGVEQPNMGYVPKGVFPESPVDVGISGGFRFGTGIKIVPRITPRGGLKSIIGVDLGMGKGVKPGRAQGISFIDHIAAIRQPKTGIAPRIGIGIKQKVRIRQTHRFRFGLDLGQASRTTKVIIPRIPQPIRPREKGNDEIIDPTVGIPGLNLKFRGSKTKKSKRKSGRSTFSGYSADITAMLLGQRGKTPKALAATGILPRRLRI